MKQRLGRWLVAVFAVTSIAVPLVVVVERANAQAVRATDDPDEEWVVVNCPMHCRTYDYDSWGWWLWCSGLPKKCSATPNGRTSHRRPVLHIGGR